MQGKTCSVKIYREVELTLVFADLLDEEMFLSDWHSYYCITKEGRQPFVDTSEQLNNITGVIEVSPNRLAHKHLPHNTAVVYRTDRVTFSFQPSFYCCLDLLLLCCFSWQISKHYSDFGLEVYCYTCSSRACITVVRTQCSALQTQNNNVYTNIPFSFH